MSMLFTPHSRLKDAVDIKIEIFKTDGEDDD